MPVTVDSLRLWNASESASEATGETNPTSAIMMDSDETLLVGLEAIERIALSGKATGGVISREAEYSNDRDTALMEWILDFESLVTPNQGSGYTLQDDERNRSINVIVEEVTWSRRGGETGEVEWALSGYHGDGILDTGGRSAYSRKNVTAEVLREDDGTEHDLGALREKRVTKSIQLKPYPIALSGPSEVAIAPDSGVMRSIVYQGVKYGTMAELRAFDSAVRGLLGTDTTVTYAHVFPGAEHTVMVDTYDSYFREGQVAAMDYYLKAVEGTADFDTGGLQE